MATRKEKFINREISWLSFNERVLQEAADNRNPLLERLRFLGIFSSNLDEFYRVRVATLKRMVTYHLPSDHVLGGKPEEIIEQIQETVDRQRAIFAKTYEDIIEALRKVGVCFLNEKDLNEKQGEFVAEYFRTKVRSSLTPVMVGTRTIFPRLAGNTIYLVVQMSESRSGGRDKYALIEVPSKLLGRFIELPSEGGQTFIMYLDDVIRYCLSDIFTLFDFQNYKAYTIKVTRDAELDIDNDVSKSLLELIERSIKQRDTGDAVRVIYDKKIPKEFLQFVLNKLKVTELDTVVAGGRYHNFRDFIRIKDFGRSDLVYTPQIPLEHPYLKRGQSVLNAIKKRDVMLHFPYHSFSHIIDLLREAAIDPRVRSIRMTLYRVADHSMVVNALLNAVRNGKKVVVVVEIKARFDEEANIFWAKKLHEEGAIVIYGVPTLKVHSKLCLIRRKEAGKSVYYANISTGNYNETTSHIYSDSCLLTSNAEITKEVLKVFSFFENNLRFGRYRELMVAPFSLRHRIYKLINQEISNAQAGKPSYIFLKLNSLVDEEMIRKLYQASEAGVKIRLIIRGICSIVSGQEGLSENIEAISIVDKYLEHARFYYFYNEGKELLYLSSSDLMARNMDHRVEVACPIVDPEIKREILDILNLQWDDNVKARILDIEMQNKYRRVTKKSIEIRAQEKIYDYLAQKKAMAEHQEVFTPVKKSKKQ